MNAPRRPIRVNKTETGSPEPSFPLAFSLGPYLGPACPLLSQLEKPPTPRPDHLACLQQESYRASLAAIPPRMSPLGNFPSTDPQMSSHLLVLRVGQISLPMTPTTDVNEDFLPVFTNGRIMGTGLRLKDRKSVV